MATEKMYYVNQYQQKIQSYICTCVPCKKGWEIKLDKTIFYPGGGGQPSDVGVIGPVRVLGVEERDGEIVHLCDGALDIGTEVLCEIDWERRFDFMQQHSGEHLVSGIIHASYGYENVGFHMGSDVITIDFSGEVTPQMLREIELAANEAVWQNKKTRIWCPEEAELQSIVYRSKKKLTQLVRLVQIAGIDICACCGTHVASAGEIGIIKLLSTVRFHDGSRVEMLCGGRALQWLNVIFDQNHEISTLISAKQTCTAQAVRRLKEEHESAQNCLMQTENTLFAHIAAKWSNAGSVVLFEAPMQPDAIRRLAAAVTGQCRGCCAVFAGEEGAYKYVICQEDADLRAMARDLNASLNGRGGGKAGLVQGSVTATRAQIEAYFQKLGEGESY